MAFSVEEGKGHLEFRQGDLDELDILLTNSCNLKCKHCYLKCGESSKIFQLSHKVVKRLILEAKELGAYKLTLSGGEPLLYPYLKDIIEHAHNNSFHIHIISNGILIDKYIDIFAGKSVSFTISVDGFKKEHEFLRGTGTFDKVISNLRLLVKKNFYVRVNTVLHSLNYNYIRDFEKFLKELGAKEVYYQTLRTTGRAKELNSIAIKDLHFLRDIHTEELDSEKEKIEKNILFLEHLLTALPYIMMEMCTVANI